MIIRLTHADFSLPPPPPPPINIEEAQNAFGSLTQLELFGHCQVDSVVGTMGFKWTVQSANDQISMRVKWKGRPFSFDGDAQRQHGRNKKKKNEGIALLLAQLPLPLISRQDNQPHVTFPSPFLSSCHFPFFSSGSFFLSSSSSSSSFSCLL